LARPMSRIVEHCPQLLSRQEQVGGDRVKHALETWARSSWAAQHRLRWAPCQCCDSFKRKGVFCGDARTVLRYKSESRNMYMLLGGILLSCQSVIFRFLVLEFSGLVHPLSVIPSDPGVDHYKYIPGFQEKERKATCCARPASSRPWRLSLPPQLRCQFLSRTSIFPDSTSAP
jgi:hypothetical protein